MKSCWLLLFVFAALLQRTEAITIRFDREGGNTAVAKVIEIDDVSRPQISNDNSVFTIPSSSQALTGAIGSLRISLRAKSLEDAAKWSFGTNATLTPTAEGLGVSVDEPNKNGAIMLTFDISDLDFSRPDLMLVFSIACDGECSIFQRTDLNHGELVFDGETSQNNGHSNALPISSGYSASVLKYEFAIVGSSLNANSFLRINQMTINMGLSRETPAPSPESLTAMSEIILDFNRASDASVKKVFRLTNVGSVSPEVTDIGTKMPCFSISPESNNLAGANGSLDVAWIGKVGAKDPESASKWVFGPNTALQSGTDGIGVVSGIEAGYYQAFIVTFDTSGLKLPPGSQLAFSVLSPDGVTYRIYRRTNERTGTLVFSMASSLQAVPSDLISVSSGYESDPGIYQFAIVAAGEGNFLRLSRFSVGVGSSSIATRSVAPRFFPFFTNNMVLQRNTKVSVYGTAFPGSSVTVYFGNIQNKSAVADSSGYWMLKLDPMRASYTPRTLSVTDGVNNSTISNVLVGDVWLCSGQSNMDRPFSFYDSLTTVGKNNPFIRLVQVNRVWKDSPMETLTLDSSLDRSWQECSSYYLENFSPAAYYFAAKVESVLNVPIGLIQSAFGGTSIEPWTPPEAIGAVPDGTLGQIFNGMIYPLRNFTFKGVLWYQGESNAQAPTAYRTLFPAMIKAWRKTFQRGPIPFYFAQLASYGGRNWDITDTAWAFLQEAQRLALNLRNTDTIVLTDAGEYIYIHPENKQAVGERFARLALKDEGTPGINTDSPRFKKMQIIGSKVVITFNKVGGGLETRQLKMNYNRGLAQGTDPDAFVVPANQLWGFAVAGPNEVFVAANATITGSDQVTVSSVYVPNPVAVRYCFEWFGLCNLYASNDGLVATPFRTDNFSIPVDFDGNESGVPFDGKFDNLGVPMVISPTYGPSTIVPVTVGGIQAYQAISTNSTRVLYASTNYTVLQAQPQAYVVVKLLYYDRGAPDDVLCLKYADKTGSLETSPIKIQIRNTLTWRVEQMVLTDAGFKKQLSGYDLRLQSDTNNFILGGAYISGASWP